jgi:hypothetical protein
LAASACSPGAFDDLVGNTHERDAAVHGPARSDDSSRPDSAAATDTLTPDASARGEDSKPSAGDAAVEAGGSSRIGGTGGNVDNGVDATSGGGGATGTSGTSGTDAMGGVGGASGTSGAIGTSGAGGTSAAAGQSGNPSAGVGGAPVPVGDSACYSRFGGALFCDGFEQATLNIGWGSVISMGQIHRASLPVYQGLGALRADTTAPGGHAFVGRRAFARVDQGMLYIRAYIMVLGAASLRGVTAVYAGSDTAPGGISVSFYNQGPTIVIQPRGAGGEHEVLVNPTRPTSIIQDVWHCLQLEVSVAEVSGAVRLIWDGEVVGATGNVNTLPTEGYTNVAAGIVYSDPTQALVGIVIDELVVDDAPAACD